MTPQARVQAAIEVLDRILAGMPAEQALTGWARASRFAGSGDRAAVRDHTFDALRCLRSYTALAGALEPSGRALMLGAGNGALFTGGGYAPAPMSAQEAGALACAPGAADLPEAVRADCPDWLLGPLKSALGPDFEPVMSALRQRAPTFLRINSARSGQAAAVAALAEEGIVAQPCSLAPLALEVVENASKIKQSRAFLDGIVELQDASSQAAVAFLPLTMGLGVLDYCAGGGGKALAMAAQGAKVSAHDAAPERMRDIAPRALRAGVKIDVLTTAALNGRSFDLVLVDAPCSGSGTWRRTPDAKWRLTDARLAELTHIQAQILDQASELVRAGGCLAYMTCSLLSAENRLQVDQFCQRHSDFGLLQERSFLPIQGGDGFYVAVLGRA